jgi:hypothetical protein
MNQCDEVRKCAICNYPFWISDLAALDTPFGVFNVCDDCSTKHNAKSDKDENKDELSKTGARAIITNYQVQIKHMQAYVGDLITYIKEA